MISTPVTENEAANRRVIHCMYMYMYIITCNQLEPFVSELFIYNNYYWLYSSNSYMLCIKVPVMKCHT